ncbi:SE1832 family protein [Jeotgalibacillus sp. S-D1]|uniref:SE1832 family protein n=1 Tax=Jeotgalibacillus sp. S-D1 TaxID=2552189 RepID=UPI0014049441|nr:SE1832 family protein [Jeotgalibacillus sp. S-D1]
MNQREIEDRIQELKMEYIRAQDDLEKLESLGIDPSSADSRLTRIEAELSELRQKQQT